VINKTRVIEVLDDSHEKEVEAVVNNLKPEDRLEIMASSGVSFPQFIAMSGWKLSARKWLILKGEEPIAVFGVVAHDKYPETGVPWLLSTKRIKTIKSFLVRNSKKYIDEMRKTYSYLFNYVDERNIFSVKWLQWCGFKIWSPTPKGVLGLKFHLFDMGVRPNV